MYLVGEDEEVGSMNVMMARAEDSIEDILFIGDGDDVNNHGFTAWKRIE